ncbi:RNA polymerase sigma factor SigI [Cytobacillus gottheilii]|uniref:RNA polymerase sigma factor SigI n=1 Tax=Cytobacillus gottheilii TaxID=859144 RepID=UPI00249459BF|nr:RNA polymerase sigma factor SigI [Cytobacillus gottheilii]
MRPMLSLLSWKKSKQSLEDTVRQIQQGDAELQNELIQAFKPFIAKTVSSVCKRYIHESDDEFSIGLIAFNEAINQFSEKKGRSLLSFSEILIKRRVIDYIRQQAKYTDTSYSSVEDGDSPFSQDHYSLGNFKQQSDTEARREEILHYKKVLGEFGILFSELADLSPKHSDARRNAIHAAQLIAADEKMSEALIQKKKLPIKDLEKKLDVSRKTIERNRKYIIAVSLIFLGDYIYLRDYIKGVLET